MKLKNLLIAFSVVAFAFSLNSCKKSNNDKDEFETTFELSGNQAVTENLTQDANDVLNEAAVDNNVMGGHTPSQTTGILSCATVTVIPLVGWPKNIVIDFGTGCTSPNGVTRKGKINIVLSDSIRKPGSTAVMTFNNYFVNNYKKEGVITWTNTSTATVVSWQRKCENGKITAPDGRYWLHFGTRDVTMTAGASTPNNILDDVYSIMGTHTVTNSSGATRTWNVLTALQKKAICANVDKGTGKIQGPNHYAIIDFGDGTCDNIATISIDGRPPRTLTLR